MVEGDSIPWRDMRGPRDAVQWRLCGRLDTGLISEACKVNGEGIGVDYSSSVRRIGIQLPSTQLART